MADSEIEHHLLDNTLIVKSKTSNLQIYEDWMNDILQEWALKMQGMKGR